ncbi:GAF domain-containing sensor histidine kinase [Pseudomonas sp. HR96]|uniref:GAF domain-containing sensor histidine kinase n=1 Tax=Pseudomonas sp. HR96 TaxID=1027966 RepID=UPI002A754DCD|nr:GAF domain-containing sensor histidine kinase [Pseudomonas sp. HR96]WPP01120.1 GAF domain-containing sensor histidine kinase [Pseudomonas sp. HR96]
MGKSVATDIATIGRINAVPAILQVICETTGMRFAAVARVTDTTWTACAVLDNLGFGLKAGGELDLTTTLCHEIRGSHQTIIIDKASEDETYCDHHTPRIYQFESYISVPVFRTDGSFFGTICALDPRPAALKNSPIQPMMESFARLLAIQMESEENVQRTEAALLREREVAGLREQFIAVLGHDLRNPLFAITAGAELLERRDEDEKRLSIIRHILTSGRRATQLVEDVLDFARGRLGEGITLNLQPCPDLAEAIQHVVHEIQRVHPERVILLRVRDTQGIVCDRERVCQLLSNLLGNAINHGASDSPIHVSAEMLGDAFVIAVHNLGQPIPLAVQTQLFQPFTRPGAESTHRGLGLGLYIANQIAVAHGGHMEVLSTAEAGTLFSFHMPSTAPTLALT